MKTFLSVAFVLVNIAGFSQSVSEKLNEYFDSAQKTGIFNGSVLIVKGGRELLSKGYGFKNAENKIANDANTVYQIGSVTKQFTASIILKLAEQRKLSLSDKLNKYFPRFPNANKITIENLLTHTSGIYNYTNDTGFMRNELEKSLTEQRFIDMIKEKPLGFEPGSKFSYSNSGYMFLGYIIENVTGKKYEHVVREIIFNPLAMTASGFDFTNLRSSNRAVGYNLINNGVGSKSAIVDSSVAYAAGAIYSTVGDIYKWNQSLTTEKILQKASLENAFTPRHSRYGFGWDMDTIQGKRRITHNGGIHGFVSYNSIIPADSVSVSILSNVASSNLGKIQQDVFAILYNQPYKIPAVNKEITLDAATLKKYVGEYEITPTFKIAVSLVEGALKAQATGQPQFDLFAKSETEFFLKVINAQVDFVKNDKGEIEKLILHQNGQDIPGKKVK